MPNKHAYLAPSVAHRWMNCPGCVALCADIPRASSSPAAEEGSAAHWLAEQALSAFKAAKPWTWPLGKWITKSGKGYALVDAKGSGSHFWEVTGEMVQHITEYTGFVIAETQARKAQLLIEMRVEILDRCFGTADAIIYEPTKRAMVVDFKYGAGVSVDAEDNEQLLCYAAGVFAKDTAMAEVEVVIIQPRDRNSTNAVRRWVIDARQLKKWKKQQLIPAAEKALSDNAPLKAGVWCRWCDGGAICPEVVNTALAVAGVDFADVKVPDPRALADKDLARVLNASQLIRDWAASVGEYALERMQGGVQVEGWKLVQKKANRKWPDEEAVIKALSPRFGPDIFEEPKLKSPKGIEDLVKKVGILKEMKPTLEGLWIIPDNGLTIAPVSDRRKAITPMEVEFQDPSPDLSFLE